MDVESVQRLKTGTTTVGIACKDGVVLAADTRATAGGLIVDKRVQKVLPVSDRIAVTMSGSVSDVQLLLKFMRAELKLRKIRMNRDSTTKEAANLLSGWVYNILRSQMGVCHFLLAGYDADPALYDIFPDGSLTKVSDFVASGSGSVIAYGLLEDQYKEGLSLEEASALALKAVNAALQRDTASGNGVNVFSVTKDGVAEMTSKVLNTRVV